MRSVIILIRDLNTIYHVVDTVAYWVVLVGAGMVACYGIGNGFSREAIQAVIAISTHAT